MTESFIKRYNVSKKQVVVLPFYPNINVAFTVKTEKTHDSFVYVSNGSPHKNHVRLLRAFKTFYNIHKRGALHLTLSKGSSEELMAELEDSTAKGYPINNHGFVEREKLAELYMNNTFTIYPSLSESFGLGIMEAIDCGCQVIGADLPYMHAVCEPSIVFDPLSEDSMLAALEKAVFGKFEPSKLIVKNQINDLIELLK
ncbi:MAG: glycosyltransferase [Bacteroidetes bacterium]|nr:glycosyltransferase [Bacteroidota bacterium]